MRNTSRLLCFRVSTYNLPLNCVLAKGVSAGKMKKRGLIEQKWLLEQVSESLLSPPRPGCSKAGLTLNNDNHFKF